MIAFATNLRLLRCLKTNHLITPVPVSRSGTKTELQAADLKAVLRQAGLRATMPRLEVHADLAKELVPLGFDRATVYRNLNDLVENGLATRVDLGDHIWRFEGLGAENSEGPEHPHFLCNDCGDIVCLPAMEIALPSKAGRPIGDVQDVVLRGRCGSC